jgi:hypothetical protein
MKLDDLIETAASNQALSPGDVESVARESGVTVAELLDRFARTVATRYLRDDCSYGFADMAMNRLSGFAHGETGPGLSDFARQVYDAFDPGEFIRDGETTDQTEQLTRELLGHIGLVGGA